jgi:hypothetical protein
MVMMMIILYLFHELETGDIIDERDSVGISEIENNISDKKTPIQNTKEKRTLTFRRDPDRYPRTGIEDRSFRRDGILC